MYQHWQRQVAPALQYDAFIDGLEKMGQTHVLKVPAICLFKRTAQYRTAVGTVCLDTRDRM
jgi:hypothetical protein